LFASKLLSKEIKVYLTSVIARYALYIVLALEVLLLPKLLSEASYGEYEYFKNLVFMFPYVLLGSYSGFIYLKYTYNRDEFKVLFTIGLALSTIISCFVGIYFKSLPIMFILISVNLFTIYEQRLKVDNKFILAFSFKPILAVFILLGAYISKQFFSELTPTLLLFTGIIAAMFIWLFLGNAYAINPFIKINKKSILRYFILIKKGLAINLNTVLLVLLMFSDRFFIEKYYNDYLGTYSFAFNLSQILVLALTTISYVSAIKIGEDKKKLTKEILKKRFFIGLCIYLVMIVGLFFGVLLLRTFYDFQHLLSITMLLAYAKGFYFLLGIISSVILYYDYQNTALKWITAAFLLNGLLGYLISISGATVFVLLALSSSIMLLYSFIILYIIFFVIEYDKKELSTFQGQQNK